MLVELSVDNIAIIDHAQIALGSGFTALTGETGAGKSLLVDSIDLALGGRADSTLVRAGAPKGSVSLVVDLADNAAARAACVELGVEPEDGQIYVQRELSAEGRSTCRIGGKLCPVGTLKQIGALLVDLHGQHDHQSLLDPTSHLSHFDCWVGDQALVLRESVRQLFEQAEALRRKLDALRTNQRDREQRLDLLRFQLNEIEAIQPQPGELETLEGQIARLSHVEKLAEATGASLMALVDSEESAQEALAGSIKQLESAAQLDPAIEPLIEPLRTAMYSLEAGAADLRRYSETLELNPEALDEAQHRAESLKRLRRKYGDDEASVLQFAEAVRSQLADLEDSETSVSEIEAALEQVLVSLSEAAGKLTALRQQRSQEFSDLVQDQLRDLAMEKAVFETAIQPKEIDGSGGDWVEFHFSANPGEPARPLSKIASGGEISRLMLALKVVLAGKAGVPTLIFDEVDTGLGGRAAAVLARKLEELARHYQVVVISHLPQIAARATTHFRIDKAAAAGRVSTTIRLLDPEERVQEIARMLAGEEVGDSAIANARELLGSGQSGQGVLLG